MPALLKSQLRSGESVNIRPATFADLPVINDIYNHYVLHSTCTYQEEPESLAERQRWFNHHGEKHPVIVALVENKLVGWCSLSPYYPRSAYRRTVENSVYVHPEQQRRGIGSALLQELIRAARHAGHHAIVALIDSEQSGSIALHTKFGFTPAGHLRQVGYKFNRWLDVIYLELILD